jgi:hypothetical protein
VIAAAAAPWCIVMYMREPEFFGQFIVEHNIKRFFASGYHEKAVWYYLPVLLIGGLPWSLLAVPLARFLLSREPAVSRQRPRGMGLLVLWAGWCFLFFSLSRGKLPPYLLPMAPAAALLVGCWLHCVLRASQVDFFQSALTSVPAQGAAVLAIILLVGSVVIGLRGLIGAPMMLAGIVFSCACLAAIALWVRKQPAWAAWTVFGLLGLTVTIVSAHVVVPAWADRRDPFAQSPEAAALLQDGRIPVACVAHEWGSIGFALHHDNIHNFDMATLGQLPTFLSEHPRCLLVIRHDEFPGLRPLIPEGMSMVRVFDAGVARVALVQYTLLSIK